MHQRWTALINFLSWLSYDETKSWCVFNTELVIFLQQFMRWSQLLLEEYVIKFSTAPTRRTRWPLHIFLPCLRDRKFGQCWVRKKETSRVENISPLFFSPTYYVRFFSPVHMATWMQWVHFSRVSLSYFLFNSNPVLRENGSVDWLHVESSILCTDLKENIFSQVKWQKQRLYI